MCCPVRLRVRGESGAAVFVAPPAWGKRAASVVLGSPAQVCVPPGPGLHSLSRTASRSSPSHSRNNPRVLRGLGPCPALGPVRAWAPFGLGRRPCPGMPRAANVPPCPVACPGRVGRRPFCRFACAGRASAVGLTRGRRCGHSPCAGPGSLARMAWACRLGPACAAPGFGPFSGGAGACLAPRAGFVPASRAVGYTACGCRYNARRCSGAAGAFWLLPKPGGRSAACRDGSLRARPLPPLAAVWPGPGLSCGPVPPAPFSGLGRPAARGGRPCGRECSPAADTVA